MPPRTRSKIHELMKAVIADFPRRKRAAEKLLRKLGITETLDFSSSQAQNIESIPTFDKKATYPLSPMLKARFEFAGKIDFGQQTWLGPNEIKRALRSKELLLHHRAKRDHWEASAPALFPNARLSLFGITDSVPENAIYLAWPDENAEPEIWVYAGYESHQFKDLRRFLEWCLKRK